MDNQSLDSQLDELLIYLSCLPFEAKFALLHPIRVALGFAEDVSTFAGMGSNLNEPDLLLVTARRHQCIPEVWNALMLAYSIHCAQCDEVMRTKIEVVDGYQYN